MAEHGASGGGGLQGSSVLVAGAACALSLAWLTQIAGDPTDGVAFFSLAFAAPVMLGIALLIAAFRRPDIFGGNLGRGGAIFVAVATLTIDNLGFVLGLLGLILVGVGVARSNPRLLLGLAVLGIGVLGLSLGMEVSEDAYDVFLPVIAAGSAVLALALWKISGES